MKKTLVVASVASMIDQFNMPIIKLMIDLGYKVDVACNFVQGSTCTKEKVAMLKKKLKAMGVNCFQVDFARNVLNIKDNIKAFLQVKKLLKSNKYVFVHCHSPIGGMITRIAGKITTTKVIYTAHGFHFYKGAPLFNWVVYYPIEWICGYWTDVLITINKEDFELARKRIRAKQVVYVPGVGVDLDKFEKIAYNETLRSALGIGQDELLLFSIGELNTNKNHEKVIQAIAGMNVYYLIAGQGEKKEYLETLIERQGMSERIKLLGFRNDIKDLLAAVDVFVFPSYREGLSMSLMEAMATGLPCVVSKIRGNTDLVDNNGGRLFAPNSEVDIRQAIENVINADRQLMGIYNRKKINNFSLNNVLSQMADIYMNITRHVN